MNTHKNHPIVRYRYALRLRLSVLALVILRPRMLLALRRARRLRSELGPAHQEYVTTVSNDVMAVSLETAALLRGIIETIAPRRVADLGSGFSSFAARAANSHAEVVSVDDDPSWLERSKDYCATRVPTSATGEFLDLVDWVARVEAGERFGLVFHDLGLMEARTKTLPAVAASVARRGLLLLDDMQKPEYGPNARTFLRRHGFAVLDLTLLTRDHISRWASVAVPLPWRRRGAGNERGPGPGLVTDRSEE